MVTISLCMIVKNEAEVLARCLDTVYEVVDEINIVDTGSTDATKEIARNYTDRIFDFTWVDDFSAARNFSFEQATEDYVLWLDADDVLTEENAKKLTALKYALEPTIDAVSMVYELGFDTSGNVNSFLSRYRLVKRQQNFKWMGAVHEYLAVGGQVQNSDIAVTHLPLTHDKDRNIMIYEKRIAKGEALLPRDLFYYANELFDHERFLEAANYYETFLNEDDAWVEDQIAACFKLADCYFQLNERGKMIAAILHSLTYDIPRPEACCRIGYFFMEQEQYTEAIHWYTSAINHEGLPSIALQNHSFSTWLPHLQLCVLYDRLAQYEKAYDHNELARKYHPDNEHVLANKVYLEGRIPR